MVVLLTSVCAVQLPAPPAGATGAVDWGDLSTAGLEPAGEPDPSTVTTFLFHLAGDDAGRAAFARTVSDPTSDLYGSYATVADLATRYGATATTQAAVVQYFAGLGLTATVDVTATYASVDMTLAQAETVFSADWQLFTWPASNFFNGLFLFFPTATPTLPPPLQGAVVAVHGAVAWYVGSPEVGTGDVADGSDAAVVSPTGAGGTAAATGTASGCPAGTSLTSSTLPMGLSPAQFLGAYGIDELQAAGLEGQGTRVAVVDDSTYEPAWLDGYRSCFGLTDATPVTPHVIGSPGVSESGETILDLSVLSAAAPSVDRFDVFMVDTDPHPAVSDLATGLITMFGAPLDASATGGEAPDVVSASFGGCEALPLFWAGRTAAVGILETVLATGVGAGVGYVVAAGDSGSSGCQHNLAPLVGPAEAANPAITLSSAWYPATSAWVTSVGGTNLTLNVDNSIASSGTWNDMAYGIGDLYYGGGGGTSSLVERPWYQAEGVPAGTMRAVPDVAAFGDVFPGYAILGPSPAPAPTPDPGTWGFVGGTSAATPLLAGAFLLLSQQAVRAGQPAHGFINPLLYQLGPTGSSSLLDITLGGNDVFGIGCCPAGPGFDLATGWGSPMANELSVALVPPTVELTAARSTVGGSVTLSARAEVPAGAVREYRWDAGGDGVTDRVTASPELTLATPTAGVTTVVLSVTTTLGRVSSTTTEVVTVAAAPAGAPLAFAG